MTADEEDNLRLAAQIASVTLVFAQQELANRVTDPTITTKGLLDIAEHSYKVSGMAKKQEAKEETSKFVFNIIMSDTETIHIEKTVEGEVLPDTPKSLTAEANELVGTLDLPEEAWSC